MFTDYERETHDGMEMDVPEEKSHQGKGGNINGCYLFITI